MNFPSSHLNALSRLVPRSTKQRLKSHLGVPSLDESLRLLKRNGFEPTAVIDVGAYQGDWTRICKAVWPDTTVLMIDPLASATPALAETAAELDSVVVADALLGASPRPSVPFYVAGTASSVLPEPERPLSPTRYVDMKTLDDVVGAMAFPDAELLKLDVQGYELEVLRGGQRALSAAEVVLLEVNLLEIHEGVPLAKDVLNYMHERGFQLYDICTLIRRPFDQALWQFDGLFARSKSSLTASRRWA